MLCCIPVKHHFSPKSSKSSGRSPSTSQRSRSAMPSTVQTDVDAASESGIFYLVPNKNGPGKSLIRRRPPPPSSPPLPDDFDAMTVGGQSTFTRGGGGGLRSGWETHGRTGGPGSVSPPIYEGGATYTAGATLTRKAGSSMDGYGSDVKSWLKSSESSPGRSTGRHGRGHSSEDFGDQRGYVDDLKKRFVGEMPSQALSPMRARRELSRNSALTKERDVRIDRDRIGPPARLGSIPRPAGNPDLIRDKAANEFQEVNRRILEDGPERTVLISTWREQVADAVDTQTVVDVYYLNEDDYAEGGEEEQDTKATSSRRGSLPLPSAPSLNLVNLEEIRSETQGGLPEPTSMTESYGSERGPTVPPKSSNRSYRAELARDRSGSGASMGRESSRAKSPETQHTRRSSNNSNSSHLTSSGRRNLPINTNLSPRSSMGVRSRQDPSSFAGRSSKNLHQPVTPTEMYSINPRQPGPSFISSNDLASTIGTIKSASVTAFEDVLSSCEPSLLHISPALNNLGISSDTHLKAITKMSEDTRDKVVKEEALRQGITVMEWAILLDRLQAL